MEMTPGLRFSYAVLGVTMYFAGLLLAVTTMTGRTAPSTPQEQDKINGVMGWMLGVMGWMLGLMAWMPEQPLLLLLPFVIVSLIALPIAHGIRRGGPLRFLFLEVTVPGFVTFVVSTALPSH